MQFSCNAARPHFTKEYLHNEVITVTGWNPKHTSFSLSACDKSYYFCCVPIIPNYISKIFNYLLDSCHLPLHSPESFVMYTLNRHLLAWKMAGLSIINIFFLLVTMISILTVAFLLLLLKQISLATKKKVCNSWKDKRQPGKRAIIIQTVKPHDEPYAPRDKALPWTSKQKKISKKTVYEILHCD